MLYHAPLYEGISQRYWFATEFGSFQATTVGLPCANDSPTAVDGKRSEAEREALENAAKAGGWNADDTEREPVSGTSAPCYLRPSFGKCKALSGGLSQRSPSSPSKVVLPARNAQV